MKSGIFNCFLDSYFVELVKEGDWEGGGRGVVVGER